MPMETVTLEEGKYTLVSNGGHLHALRYGELWQGMTGNKLVGAAFSEIQELRKRLSEVHAWIVCAGIATPEDMMQNAERIAAVTAPTWPEGDRHG